jgi:hypothetical protein
MEHAFSWPDVATREMTSLGLPCHEGGGISGHGYADACPINNALNREETSLNIGQMPVPLANFADRGFHRARGKLKARGHAASSLRGT